MAGFLRRVRRITLGKINAFLDGAENPEQIFPLLVQEMREQSKKAVDAEATAVASLRRREQERDEARAELSKWTSRAELAVQKDDDDLARTAIEQQMAAEKVYQRIEDAVQVARRAAEQAREAREDLHAKLHTLEQKRDEILARARAAKQQEEVQKVLAGVEAGGGSSILDAVARMEEKVVEQEARSDAYGEIAHSGDEAEAAFRDLEKKQRIDERLAELKAKVKGKSAGEE